MTPRNLRAPRGQTLLGVLVSATIMVVVSMALFSMFKSQSQVSRNIAARGGVTDLSHALDALFGSPGCGTIGSANFSAGGVSPATITLIPGPPATYSLALDTLNFPNGSVAITSAANPAIWSMIQPYSISGITFTALGGQGVGFYPFQMTVTFTHPTGGPPPLPINKFITVVTNNTAPPQVVGACYRRPRSSMMVQVFDASGTFTVPAETNVIQVEVWGGGGGGTGGAGGSGAGGGYALCILDVSPGQTYAVTVGGGGAACPAWTGACPGATAGGNSSFVGNGYNCNASGGGQGCAAGGAGGTGNNGSINLTGGNGEDLTCGGGVGYIAKGGAAPRGGDGGTVGGGCAPGWSFNGKAPGGGGGATCWGGCRDAGPGAPGSVHVRF